MIPSNYHTHTLYCDGHNTPRELVLEALRLGCPEIGFSGHSYTYFDEGWCMSEDATEKYKADILALRDEFGGRIKILMGIEQDYYSEAPTDGYDYVIGSVHYVKKDGVYLTVDESREQFMKNVVDHYGGDVYGFIEDYYRVEADVYNRTHCNIIGHFDLITKFNEGGCLFDTAHPRYKKAADEALYALLDSPAVFELNTGAVARGYRATPYPEKRIRDIIESRGKTLIPNSDCHNKEQLLFGLI